MPQIDPAQQSRCSNGGLYLRETIVLCCDKREVGKLLPSQGQGEIKGQVRSLELSAGSPHYPPSPSLSCFPYWGLVWGSGRPPCFASWIPQLHLQSPWPALLYPTFPQAPLSLPGKGCGFLGSSTGWAGLGPNSQRS